MKINEHNYEVYLYRYQEHLLTEEERQEVEAFLATHPQQAEEMALYDAQLKLTPQTPAPQMDKQVFDSMLLKSMNARSIPWRRIASIAACVALVIGGGLWGVRHLSSPANMLPTDDAPLVANADVLPIDTVRTDDSHLGGIPTSVTTMEKVDNKRIVTNISDPCVQPKGVESMHSNVQLAAKETSSAMTMMTATPMSDGQHTIIDDVMAYNDGGKLPMNTVTEEDIIPTQQTESNPEYPVVYPDDLVTVVNDDEGSIWRNLADDIVQYIAQSNVGKGVAQASWYLANGLQTSAQQFQSKSDEIGTKIGDFQDSVAQWSNNRLVFTRNRSLLPSLIIAKR